MNFKNYNRIGQVVRRLTDPDDTSDLVNSEHGSLGSENDNAFDQFQQSDCSSNDSNDPVEQSNKVDNWIDLINNNPRLTENYLLGSESIQSSKIEDIDDIYCEDLYPGSETTVFDLIIILELIKSTIKLGDVNESIILGLLASFLPPDNAIKIYLSQTSFSIYNFQKLINKSSSQFNKCSIVKIPICNKCTKVPFCGNNRLPPRCIKCRTLKNVKSIDQKYIFYLPLKDRLFKLLISDLSNLFLYPELRNVGSADYIQDTYDGSNWKSFDDLMNFNEKLIGLQWCWDGADSFSFSGKSFWPGCISILNFPLDLRSKLHVGMHVISLCEGMCIYTKCTLYLPYI